MELDLEKRIEDAIVQRFFEPSWMVTTQQVVNPQNGTIQPHVVPTQIPAPMTVVAQAIYDRAKAEIIRKVMEQLDINAIVEEWAPKITKEVVEKLNATPGNHWSSTPSKTDRQRMLDRVYERVAEEFGRQCVERIRETGGLMAILDA